MQVTVWKCVTAVSVSTISVGIKSAAFKGLRHSSDCSRRNTRLRLTLAGFMDVSYPSKYRISGNFRCKNIFVVAINHENFIHEIIFTRVNSYCSQNLSRC